MKFYRAVVRYGGPILFWMSLLVFLVSFSTQFKMGEQMTYSQFPSDVGQSSLRLVFLLNALSTALTHAALTFFGACVLDRADRFLSIRDSAK